MGILHRPGLRRASLFLLATSLLAQTWTTFYSAYLDGLAAQARGDPATALKAFERAAALEPSPGTRVHTYGLNFLPTYYPYLRTAEAALAQGDLARARAALASPQSVAMEPAAQREALLARLQTLQRAVEPRPAPPLPEPPAVATPSPLPLPAAPAPVRLAPQTGPAEARGLPTEAPRLPAEAPRLPAPARTAAAGPPQPPRDARPQPPPATRPQPVAPAENPSTTTADVAASAPAPVPRGTWGLPGKGLLALAAGLLALAGGLRVLRRRHRKPAPTPWKDLADTRKLGVMALPPDTDANLGRRFGPWEVRHVLGRGGCATAYQAIHTGTGAEAAIKVPHSHLLQDHEFLARFRREATLGALLDHPRIVRILDPGPVEGAPWLVMPFVRGITLEAHLQRTGPLSLAQAVHIAADVAEAMAYAHTKGIVHRDLKPANIMLGEDGAVVMDLGIARLLESTKLTSMYIGTPTYSAPEGMATPSVGPPADRYALGIILFEMLVGHPPFQGDSPFQVFEAHRFNPLPDLAVLRPGTPPALVRLIQRLCEKLPEDRPEDGETLRILTELRKTQPLA